MYIHICSIYRPDNSQYLDTYEGNFLYIHTYVRGYAYIHICIYRPTIR